MRRPVTWGYTGRGASQAGGHSLGGATATTMVAAASETQAMRASAAGAKWPGQAPTVAQVERESVASGAEQAPEKVPPRGESQGTERCAPFTYS